MIKYLFIFFFSAESCRWADEIVPNVPYDPSVKLLDELKCTHVAHGDDLIFKEDGSNVYSEFMATKRFVYNFIWRIFFSQFFLLILFFYSHIIFKECSNELKVSPVRILLVDYY